MVRPRRWWIGIAAGVALGLGGVVAVEVATEDASAQGGFRVSAEQLRINQRISQAAVRRSNESLQLLDPIRRRQNQPARVLGWRTQDLRDSAITTAKLNDSAITTAKLANDSVTNEKLGPNAVTGAKIAGGTITAANIENGQVVKGNGSLLSARVVLGLAVVDQAVLDLPGIGLIRASCTAGVGATSFLNQSGSTADVTASGVNAGTLAPAGVAVFQTGLVANTTASTTLLADDDGGTHTWQIGYTDAAGAAHVATASVTVVPLATDCVVTAQALSTG